MHNDLPTDISKIDFDNNHIWHPYAKMKASISPELAVSASGVRIRLANGKELIDGMSSWWSTIHGYGVKELNDAAIAQIKKMSHVMFGGLTHEPAIALAKQLIELTPSGIEKVFFCDSGSVAVEVAIKMALQYQQVKHKARTKLLTMRGGYYGDTTGAMSICDPHNGMHAMFTGFLPQQIFVDRPTKRFGESCVEEDLTPIQKSFEQHSKEVAAFIVEPIVQGAGGMWFYSADYLKEIQQWCHRHDILFILDEIATGFGRTGHHLFAGSHAEVQPDIMCVGKAMTGGYVSLAATLCTASVAERIDSGEAGALMHGPTFMANPLACSIALASIRKLLASTWKTSVDMIAQQMKEQLTSAQKLPNVKEVRVMGGIGVVETHQLIDTLQAQQFFVQQGVWIRPFRNLIYIMPPYIISKNDLTQLCDSILLFLRR